MSPAAPIGPSTKSSWTVPSGTACAAAWVNFGVFHSSRIVHYWDTFHYYVGSKYFEENEYERLYRDSFQHGGISLEEMMCPFAILRPRTG